MKEVSEVEVGDLGLSFSHLGHGDEVFRLGDKHRNPLSLLNGLQ